MISKRGLAAATASGAGIVLLAAGAASACTIANFQDSVACDSASGKAVITVSNSDHGIVSAAFTVYVTGTKTVVGTGQLAQGPDQSVDIAVPWISQGSWTVHVKTDKYGVDKDMAPVTTDQTSCGSTPTPTPAPSTPAPTASGSPTPTAAPTPSASASSTTVAVVATSPATSATPTATLAETGSSGTGMVATLAGVLVAAGGGALYFLRRRPAGSRG